MGSGGNVGRAIYARDLSRDKSRGEYIRAHMFPRWRNTLAHEEEEEASHGGGIGFMCELASTDHPFFSFELPFHLLLPLALAADRRFPRERSFGPAYLLNASSIFPSPVRNSYTSAREHACNLPRFRKRVRKPDVSCQWELIRHSRGISYESCVNNTKRRGKKDGRD